MNPYRSAIAVLTSLMLLIVLSSASSAQGDVSVTPDGGSTSATANSSGNTVQFTVENTAWDDEYEDDFGFGCSKSGSVSSCSVSPSSAYLMVGEDVTVTVTFSTGSAGSGTVTLSASGMYYSGYDTGYYNVTVTGGSSGPPPAWMDTLPYNYDNQDMSRCASGCFAATHAFSTVPYYSLDTPRNVTLVYNGARVDPQPFVHLNVQKPSGSYPNQVWLKVREVGEDWEYFTNGSQYSKHNVLSSGWQRIGAQLRDTKTWTTGMYDIEISVIWKWYATTLTEESWTTKLMVVNENNSPISRGWTIAGVQTIHEQTDESVLITEGDGSAKYFRKSGSSFTSPSGEFSKLWPNGSGWKRTYPDSTEVYFNSSGYMTDVYDRFNNRTQFLYSGSRLYRINDPDGNYIYLYYYSNPDRLYYIRNSSNYSGSSYAHTYTYFSVNSSDRTLSWAKDPDNVYTYFYYDASDRLNQVKDRRGHTTTLAYASTYGTLASVTAPAVAIHDSSSSVSPVTEFEAWQKIGVPSTSSVISAVAVSSVKGEIEEPGGGTTEFTVNRWGQPLATTNALNQTTTVTYHANLALPYSVTHPNGHVDYTYYNSNGTLYKAKYKDAASSAIWDTTSIQYHSTWVTLPTQISATNQPTQTFGVSAGKTTWSQVGPADSLRYYYYYDSRGRLYKTTDDQGSQLTYAYFLGINGNRSKDVLPGGAYVSYGYDNHGRQKWTQRNGEPKDSVSYDSVNRVTHAYDADGEVTVFTYDNLHLTKVKDAENQEYEFSHNALGWLTSREDPQDSSETYEYSLDGDLMRWTNRRGQNTDYGYDALHRMIEHKYKRGTSTVTNSYAYHSSSSDNWALASNAYASDSTVFFKSGPVKEVVTRLAGKAFTRNYYYLAGGLLDSIRTTTSSGPSFVKREYAYDTSVGNLASIKLNGYSSGFGYDDDGNRTKVTHPGYDVVNRQYTVHLKQSVVSTNESYNDEIWRGLEYNDLQQMLRHMHDNNGVLWARQYTYDNVGRAVGDTTQRWDGNDCEVDEVDGYLCEDGSWLSTADYRAKFEYDDVGNRIDHSGSYDTGNRITSFDGCTYQTDPDGNVESRTGCSSGTPNARFHWTSDNRLMAIKLTSSGDSLEFYYDAGGRVVKKVKVGSGTSYYYWEGQNLYAELDGSGNKVAEYSYYGMDNLHAVVVGTEPYFAHRDGLGNVIVLTDRQKYVKREHEYNDIWGSDVSSSGTLPSPCTDCDRARFKDALYLGEEAEIYYMRNRWYEPHTGRFLSEDPIGLRGGINLYAYAGADPLNMSDPLGLYRVCPPQVDIESADDGSDGIVVTGRRCYEHYGGLFSYLRGLHNSSRYTWPLHGPTSSNYWDDRDGGARRHRGIDQKIPPSAVTPIAPGVVDDIGFELVGAGLWLSIRHRDGSISRYLHLGGILAEIGQVVDRSTLIAVSGKSGGDAWHLHWDVEDAGGNPFDPIPYMIRP